MTPTPGSAVEALTAGRRGWVACVLELVEPNGLAVVSIPALAGARGGDTEMSCAGGDTELLRVSLIRRLFVQRNSSSLRQASKLVSQSSRVLGVHSLLGETVMLVFTSSGKRYLRHGNLSILCPKELASDDVTLAAAERLLANYMETINLRAEVGFCCCTSFLVDRACLL